MCNILLSNAFKEYYMFLLHRNAKNIVHYVKKEVKRKDRLKCEY